MQPTLLETALLDFIIKKNIFWPKNGSDSFEVISLIVSRINKQQSIIIIFYIFACSADQEKN